MVWHGRPAREFTLRQNGSRPAILFTPEFIRKTFPPLAFRELLCRRTNRFISYDHLARATAPRRFGQSFDIQDPLDSSGQERRF